MEKTSDPDFEQFWTEYPRKEGKKDAMKAWMRLESTDRFAAREAIGLHVKFWNLSGRERQYIPMAGTWLRGERWSDELAMPQARRSTDDWMRSTAGIEGKARQLGMWPPRAGEDWHSLKTRILAKVAA